MHPCVQRAGNRWLLKGVAQLLGKNSGFSPGLNTLTTRTATPADLDAVATLFDAYRQFYEQPADLVLARQFIQARMACGESEILVAQNAAGDIVGFCQLYPTFCSVEAQPIYALYDLFVVPHARRLGAGRALLLAAEQLARDKGKARMDLTTAKTNQAAQSVYESLGWVRDEIFYAYNRRVELGHRVDVENGSGR
jgi:ribosomal protein S18 acetylase RimI-like enzyme